MGVLLLLQSLSNQFCGPSALPSGGLGCSPPTSALLKCPKSASWVSHRRRRRQGTPSWASHVTALALLSHLPELTLCMCLAGARWSGVLRSSRSPCARGLVLQRQRPLRCIAFLVCLPCLPSQRKHAAFIFSRCARQKGLSSLSPRGEGAVPVLARAGGPSPSPHICFLLLARPQGG